MLRTVACFVPEIASHAYPGRTALKEQVLIRLGVLVTLVFRYINTLFLLAGRVTYLVSLSTECACSTCKP
jgi:hypothetical protein